VKATLVVYQENGEEPVVIELETLEDQEPTVITLHHDRMEMTTPQEPTVIPVASCHQHFASSLDVQGGTNPESWWFKCRVGGEVYTYAELMKAQGK
jgi:hypothetical protein